MPPKVILASTSPRRYDLLSQLNIEFEVCKPEYEEVMDDRLPPNELAAELALGKALSVSKTRPNDVVIGADTFLALDNSLLGKPKDAEHAIAMLKSLSGRSHQVITGFAVAQGDREHSTAIVSTVTMRALTTEEITSYVAGGEPLDKAGAYALQGVAGAFVERVDGDVSAIIGLPLAPLTVVLRRFGVEILGA